MKEYVDLDIIEKTMSKGNIIKFTQELYSKYMTIKMDSELDNIFSEILSKYIHNIPTQNINTRRLYNTLVNKYYHNEITIKSNFINNVLFKSNDHITVFELNAGTSRLDLCKVNGISVAYEIKTDLDNLTRLSKQLLDYMELFEKTYVICSKEKVQKIINTIPEHCGVYSYQITKKGIYKFKVEKQAKNSINLNSNKQLNLLTKNQLVKISNQNSKCEKSELIDYICSSYSKNKINKIFKEQIKIKYKNKWTFLENNNSEIYEIDYQWFFNNTINPSLIYK
jgi:hypothetical protein